MTIFDKKDDDRVAVPEIEVNRDEARIPRSRDAREQDSTARLPERDDDREQARLFRLPKTKWF